MTLVRAMVNGWLLAFWADTALALVDEALALVIGVHVLAWIRGLTAALVVLGLPFLWLGVGLSPQLPIRVFLAPMVFLAWVVLGASPVSVWLYGTPWMGPAIAGVQILVAALVAWQVQAVDGRGGKRALLLDALADRPALRWPRFGAWVGVQALVVPPLLLGYVWGSADLTLRHATAGYVSLGADGIRVAHRELARGDDRVDLIGMIHLGDRQAYEALFAPFPVEGTVVLEEGVSDREGRLPTGPIYDKVAGRLGVSAQRPISEMSALATRNADLDVSAFSEDTLKLLSKVFRIYNTDDLPAAVLDYLNFMREKPDRDAFLRGVMADIIDKRNDHLLGEVEAALQEDFQRIVVPWGAYHLPDVEASLVGDGFVMVSERRVTLIPFPWAR